MQAPPPPAAVAVIAAAAAKAKALDKGAAAPDTPKAAASPGSPRSRGLSEALSRAKALALARTGGKVTTVVSTNSSDTDV
jgi:hypothetical protein